MRKGTFSVFVIASVLIFAACGEDATEQMAAEDNRLSNAEPVLSGDPLTFTADNTYVPLALPVPRGGSDYRSDLALLPQDDTFAALTTAFGGVVVTLPVLDETDARFDPDGGRSRGVYRVHRGRDDSRGTKPGRSRCDRPAFLWTAWRWGCPAVQPAGVRELVRDRPGIRSRRC